MNYKEKLKSSNLFQRLVIGTCLLISSIASSTYVALRFNLSAEVSMRLFKASVCLGILMMISMVFYNQIECENNNNMYYDLSFLKQNKIMDYVFKGINTLHKFRVRMTRLVNIATSIILFIGIIYVVIECTPTGAIALFESAFNSLQPLHQLEIIILACGGVTTLALAKNPT